MKRYLAFILLLIALVFADLSARAQTYGTLTILAGGTNNIANAASNVYSAPIDCTQRANVSLYMSANSSGANTNFINFTFRSSEDGTTNTMDLSQAYVFQLISNGTNKVSMVTNITVNATGYLILTAVHNPGSTLATNVTVTATLKPGRSLY